MVTCPICGSKDVTKLKTGSYRCNSCGFVFYPTRDAIIDMRDLLTAEELTEEEINKLGKKIEESTSPIGEEVFGGKLKNVFRSLNSLDEILAQYNEDDRVFGIFVDFVGNIRGTFLIMVHENSVNIIKKAYGKETIVEALKIFGTSIASKFKKNFRDYLEIEKIDIAYDTILSMINYLISDIAGDREVMFLNVKMQTEQSPRGEIIFVPQKESIKYLKRLLNE